MTLIPSQGETFAGITGITNIRVRKAGADPTDSSNRLDASTLDLDVGDNRVYVDGLPDAGQGGDESGITTTVTVQFLGTSTYSAGDEVSYDGTALICTESETEYAVGELVRGTVTFVTKPPEEAS
jgi:hypothetical protein